MDEDRRIRFLVAPLLFFGSLAWGFVTDPTHHPVAIPPGSEAFGFSLLLGVVLGGGIAVFTAGYVIGTLSYVFLRLAFWIKASWFGGSRFHEISLPDAAFKEVWSRLEASGEEPDRRQELFAGVTFDHGVLRGEYEGGVRKKPAPSGKSSIEGCAMWSGPRRSSGADR